MRLRLVNKGSDYGMIAQPRILSKFPNINDGMKSELVLRDKRNEPVFTTPKVSQFGKMARTTLDRVAQS
jgi:hypothetical protein